MSRSFSLEHLAVVGVGARLLLRGLPRGDHVGRLGEHAAVDVAERDDLDRRDLDEPEQVALAVPAAADQADARGLLVGCSGPPGRPPPLQRGEAKASPAAPVCRKSQRFMTTPRDRMEINAGNVGVASGRSSGYSGSGVRN